MNTLSRSQWAGLILAGCFYIFAGAMHFLKSEMYVRIVPPYIPWPRTMVYVSGFFEILGGLGLFVPRVRRAAAWGLVALLAAVFPANLYMATDPTQAGAASFSPTLLWVRLPIQVLLIWWVLWCTGPRRLGLKK